MKLMDKLAELDKGTQIQIGSKSAYFFMGTPDEFKSEILDLNGYWRNKFASASKNARKKYEQLLSQPPEPGKTVVKVVWKDGRKVVVTLTYEEAINDWNKRLDILKLNSDTADTVLKRFVTFDKREVTEVYKNIDEDALIILVTGDECGRFWLRTEWERYKNGETIVIDSSDDEEGGEEYE